MPEIYQMNPNHVHFNTPFNHAIHINVNSSRIVTTHLHYIENNRKDTLEFYSDTDKKWEKIDEIDDYIDQLKTYISAS